MAHVGYTVTHVGTQTASPTAGNHSTVSVHVGAVDLNEFIVGWVMGFGSLKDQSGNAYPTGPNSSGGTFFYKLHTSGHSDLTINFSTVGGSVPQMNGENINYIQILSVFRVRGADVILAPGSKYSIPYSIGADPNLVDTGSAYVVSSRIHKKLTTKNLLIISAFIHNYFGGTGLALPGILQFDINVRTDEITPLQSVIELEVFTSPTTFGPYIVSATGQLGYKTDWVNDEEIEWIADASYATNPPIPMSGLVNAGVRDFLVLEYSEGGPWDPSEDADRAMIKHLRSSIDKRVYEVVTGGGV